MREDSRSNFGGFSCKHLHGKKNYEVLLKNLPGILSLLYITADFFVIIFIFKTKEFSICGFMGAHNIISTLPDREKHWQTQPLLKEINLSLLFTEQNLSVLSQVNCSNGFYLHNLLFFSFKITGFLKKIQSK